MEAGLFSFGNTIGYEHTPFEAGLGKYCDGLESCLGGAALADEAQTGPSRKVCGLIFETDDFLVRLHQGWPVLDVEGCYAGEVTGISDSVHVGRPIGLATLGRAYWGVGTQLRVQTPQGPRTAHVTDLPFRP